MRTAIITIALLAATGTGYAADPPQSLLDYFKSRLPATTPPAATDSIPILQGGAAMRMIRPADLGVTGPAGPQGIQGDPGPPLGRWVGEYDPQASYPQDDIVTYQGSVFRCAAPEGCNQ